jgi:hypothetical protein
VVPSKIENIAAKTDTKNQFDKTINETEAFLSKVYRLLDCRELTEPPIYAQEGYRGVEEKGHAG